MKTPTLEEVQEYFKDAEEVQSLFYPVTFKINHKRRFYFVKDFTWNCYAVSGKSFCLWDIDRGFAQILKSKEPKITITISQIDALPNNEKLGEYVRSLRNNL